VGTLRRVRSAVDVRVWRIHVRDLAMCVRVTGQPFDCFGALHGRRTLDAYGRYTVTMGIAIAGTFAATGETILYLGARPVFADIIPETLNLDPRQVERVITRREEEVLQLPCIWHVLVSA